MKFRTRFLLCFIAVVLVMVGFLSFYINFVLTERVHKEKAESYTRYLRQLATSVYLTTRQTEQALFNQYNVQGLAAAMLTEQEPVAKALNLQNLLSAVHLNVTGVRSVMAIDRDGTRFFAGRLPENRPETIEQVLSPDIYDQFTLWLRDAQGTVYLKKDVYRIFPLQYAGIIVAQLDTDSFIKSVGLDMQGDGMMAILTKQGRLLAQTGGMTEETLAQALTAQPLSFKPVSRRITLDGRDCWLTVEPAVNQSWYALSLVPMTEMLAMPRSLSRFIWLGSVVIIAFALALDTLVAHSITRNAQALLRSMEEVSRGNFDVDIPVRSRDEIGQLAGRFRWMQSELKEVTAKMVLQATEKQQAEYEMLELRYRSLLAQVSPHFLCNVLSTINALSVMGKNDQVSALSVKASRYLRDNLNASEQKFTVLSAELHSVGQYVDLYRDVYGGDCVFETDVEDECGDARVPNMLLQPLVENALYHGRCEANAESPLNIRVIAKRENDTLVLRVINDGVRIDPAVIGIVEQAGAGLNVDKKLKGFGLRGALQRLRLLYGDRQSLRIGSDPDGWSGITIRIPFERFKEEER